MAERIPFIELTQWDHQKLYALKGQIVSRGIRAVTGLEMPIFEKRRFQHGVGSNTELSGVLNRSELDLRRIFEDVIG